ncbi:MAG: hypothetical protein ACI4FZ_07275 [Lachnospiraceae bacterium]
MGLWQRLFKKKKKSGMPEGQKTERIQELPEGGQDNRELRTSYIQANCEMIVEARRQNLEAKKEYEVVTSYLADIQRIDMMPAAGKKEIEDCARKIINLNEEREKMQKIPAKITVAQRLALEPYEQTMPEEIRRMEEEENYQQAINSDLRQLESEKASLNYEIEDIVERSAMLKKLMTVICVFVVLLFCFLFFLQESVKKDVQIPFLLTVAFGILAAGYFFYTMRKNLYDLRVAEKRKSRAIYLLNKVKIKYVNCTNLLDYTYEKFHVSNSKELHYHWQEYMRLVEEERRFQKTNDLIDYYNEALVNKLKEQGIVDAAIWMYQPEALLDAKEMVEVRHRLNVRRQKLRQRIDFNNGQEEQARKTIRAFAVKYPEYKQEVQEILEKNEIEY